MTSRPRGFKNSSLKYGALTFVDLLGFSSKVKGIKKDAHLFRTIDDVALVQKQFEVRPNDALQKEEHKLLGKKVRAFSDCLVITVPLRSKFADEDGYFDLLMQEIDDIGLSQGSCVQRGIFLRGGVDLDFWYEKKDVLISPALVRAAEMEKDISVPMIAIGDQYFKHLSKHRGRYFYSKNSDPITRLFRKFDVPRTKKSWWFIDYISICLESVDDYPRTKSELNSYKAASQDEKHRLRGEIHKANFFGWIRDHREKIMFAMANAKTKAIKDKYVWLAKYHNGTVRRIVRSSDKSLFIPVGNSFPGIGGRKPPRKSQKSGLRLS